MEENQSFYFQNDLTQDLPTHLECTWAGADTSKRQFLNHLFYFSFGGLILYFGWSRGYFLSGSLFFLLVSFLYAVPLFLPLIRTRNGGKSYQKILFQGGGRPTSEIVYFHEQGICLVFQPSGNRLDYLYTQICGWFESKNLLCLSVPNDQFIVLDKRGFSGGTEEAFRAFLLQRCPGLKNRKPGSVLPGKILRYGAYVSIGLVVLVSVLSCVLRYFPYYFP